MTVQPFISELIRAANQVEKLSEPERARLLDRAGRTIQDMRDQTGMGGEPSFEKKDAAWNLRLLARKHGTLSDDQVALAFLDAVEMMRTLQIMLDAERENEGNNGGG